MFLYMMYYSFFFYYNILSHIFVGREKTKAFNLSISRIAVFLLLGTCVNIFKPSSFIQMFNMHVTQ